MIRFKLNNPEPGQYLPGVFASSNNVWKTDVVPRKGERVNLSGFMFDVVNVEHEIRYGSANGEAGLSTLSTIYLKAH